MSPRKQEEQKGHNSTLKRGKPLQRKGFSKKSRKRINPFGSRGKRIKELDQPFIDYVMEGRKLGGLCDSCGRFSDTLRFDHVSKKKPRRAWKDGKGNGWATCHKCDTFKEAHGQHRLDEAFPNRPTGKEVAKAWGEMFRALQEGKPAVRSQGEDG